MILKQILHIRMILEMCWPLLKKKEVGYDDVVSEIATFLLSIIGLDMDISQNYIGI
jgi:hypothetical protein